MAGLDNPNGSPFMVGEKQREWLAKDLAGVDKGTPVVVFSHSPIQKIYKGWNFWTEDAEQVQDLLQPFEDVTVVYGHVHQIQYNQIDNISFHAVMATAWPWPYPQSYAQADEHLPILTVPMNRADPFFERDATGWELIDVNTGRVAMHYKLYDNTNRTVAFDPKTGELIEGDIADETLVRDTMREHGVTAVMHFAAKALVGESVRDPELYDRWKKSFVRSKTSRKSRRPPEPISR